MLKTVGNLSTRTGDQTIVNGNLIIGTAGKGIDFSADPSAPGMTSELLDDYEEGTWTPVLSDAASGGNNSATAASSAIYTKVGRLVTVQCFFSNIDTTGMTSGNDLFVTGFPFTAASLASSSFFVGSIIMQATAFSGSLAPFILDNTTYGRIAETQSGAIADFITVADLTSTQADFYLTITYQAA